MEDFSRKEEEGKEIHHHHYHKDRRFHFGSFVLGLVLILGGVAYLAKMNGLINYNINLSWSAVWPVILILIGLSMLSGRGFLSAILGIVMALIILGLLFYFLFGPYRGQMMSNYAYSGSAPCVNLGWRN